MAGLYVHIPLCKSKCIYCDFYSTPRAEMAERIIEGLIQEFEYRRNEIQEPFTTIYIGGGTPSVVPPELLARLVTHFPLAYCEEFTIEVNPDDVTDEAVRAWCEMGVNRVSMGIQSLDNSILRIIRRRHSAEQALEAIETLRRNGIKNISCDLIYGLPGLTDEVWRESLEQLLSKPISHLSAYCLTYNEGTLLYDMMLDGRITPATDEEIERQFAILRKTTAQYNFEHYEISNFARPGLRSRHNSSYWNPGSAWLGIGPSAHSFDLSKRRIDIADTSVWLDRLPMPCDIDEESELDRLNDNIVTALRTAQGLDLQTIDNEYTKAILDDAQKYIQHKQMSFDGRFLAIKPDYWLISDTFIRELIQI